MTAPSLAQRIEPLAQRIELRRSALAPQVPWTARVPLVAGLATAVVALVNLASALTPDIAARAALIHWLAPFADVRVAHALALPVGGALAVAAWRLARGSRQALDVAVGLLVAAAVLNVVKGLDVEEAALSLATAAGLLRHREEFAMTDRPRRLRRGSAPAGERSAAAAVARAHGAGTLGTFTLRSDVARIWSPDGRAYTAYRVEAGTLLLAGDPVGDPASHGLVLDRAIAKARAHGLALGVIAAGDAYAAVARERGLRRLYVGDEAIIPTGAVDLGGRARKSLRKAVNRVTRHGYTAELHRVGDLDRATLDELERISALWRDGADERGFSMGHDRLDDELLPDATVVLARDGDGAIRGFLHFVPVFGSPQVSLAFMRRDRDTPNGVSEYLVVESCALLAAAGIQSLSLNFAPFGGLRRNPRHAGERAIVAALLKLDRLFGLSGLEGFNQKFDPAWQPRHLLFSSPGALPQVLVAAMICEGLIRPPRLRIPVPSLRPHTIMA